MISFKTTRDEAELIHRIAQRAIEFAESNNIDYTLLECSMDLSACIAQGVPLQLNELLKADDGEFTHDVFGIRQHINRETGQLENCFHPRYAE